MQKDPEPWAFLHGKQLGQSGCIPERRFDSGFPGLAFQKVTSRPKYEWKRIAIHFYFGFETKG